MKATNKNSIMWIVGIVVVVAVVAFFATQGEDTLMPEEEETPDSEVDLTDETDETNEEGESSDRAPEEQVTDESLSIEDQAAGSEVVVSSISVSDARWVVIHEDQDGEPGNILGARLFFPQHTEGRVSLLRSTEPGEQYYALMYSVAEREEEQGRVFDRNRDVPLVDDSGELFMVPFTTLEDEDGEQE